MQVNGATKVGVSMNVHRCSMALVLCTALASPAQGERRPDNVRAWRHPTVERFGSELGLPSGEVVSMREDRSGYLWAATLTGGVSRFDGERFERFGPEQGLAAVHVKQVVIDRLERVVLATVRGLFVFEGGRFARDPRFRVVDELQVNSVLHSRTGSWWIATRDGLYELGNDGTMRRLFGQADGLPTDEMTDVVEDTKGDVWVGLTQGIARIHQGAVQFWKPERDGPTDGFVTRLLPGRDGDLWMATDHGLQHFSQEHWTSVSLDNNGSPTYVLDLAFGPQGLLFLATAHRGVLCLNGSEVLAPDTGESAPVLNVWSLLFDSEGGLFLGTGELGLVRLSLTAFERAVPSSAIDHALAQALALTPEGDVWVGTQDHGAFKLSAACLHDGDARCIVRHISTNNGLVSNSVRTISALPENSDDVVFGTQWGPFQLNGNRIEGLDELPQPYPARGLWRRSKNEFFTVNKEEGLVHFRRSSPAAAWVRTPPSSKEPSEAAVPEALWSMAPSDKGTLWLGGTQKLFAVKDQGVQAKHLETLPVDDRIVDVFSESDAVIWFRSNTAVGVWSNDEVSTLPLFGPGWFVPLTRGEMLVKSDEALHRIQYRPRTPSTPASLVMVERLSSPQGYPVGATGAAVVDIDGTVLFGAIDGIYRFRPASKRRTATPHLHLLSLGHDQPSTGVGASTSVLSLEPNANFLSVRVDAVTFPSPSSVVFRYQLEGSPSGWSTETTSRTMSFSNLAPGDYQVRVQARQAGNDWNAEVLSRPVHVRPLVWQTTWFRFCAAALAVLAVAAVPLWRARRLRIRRDELEREVRARTEELAHHASHLEQLVSERTQQLQHLTDHQLDLLDGERRAIARDLHDEAGQLLSVMQMELFLLAETTGEPTQWTGGAPALPRALRLHVERLQEKTNELSESFRRTLLRLRPRLLDDRGLPAALNWLCESLATSSGVSIETNIADGVRLESDLGVLVYRIAQEALSNAAVHSKATHISASLHETEVVVVLTVRDNGVGFDLEDVRRGSRLGVLGMTERARAVGAKLDVASTRGEGTVVTLEVSKAIRQLSDSAQWQPDS